MSNLCNSFYVLYCRVCLESHCALTKGVGSYVHERLFKSGLKQLQTLQILHFNHCLTTEYSETTAHCNGNSILTAKSTYLSLSAQWLSERIVLCLFRLCLLLYTCRDNCKGNSIPLQAWKGPESSRRLRLPDFKTIGTWRWQGCQDYAPATFTPRKYSWYSLLLEDESTSRPLCGRKDCQWKIRSECAECCINTQRQL
jgi:hypothetical protein